MNRALTFQTQAHRVVASALMWALAPAMAQQTPIARPGPIPPDISPRVQLSQCGDFLGHFGPLDYRNTFKQDKRLVEEWHFDAELSMFMRGQLRGQTKAGTTNATSGFQYTLKAMPNHPVALKVMEEAARKMGTEQPSSDYPMECWYIRAFMIAPDDPMVRAFYGVYLAHRQRQLEARHNLDIADKGLRESGTMQYILGQTRLTIKDYQGAQVNSMRATLLGYRSDELERTLRAAGHWNERLSLPPDATDVSPPPSPASAASASTG